MKLVIQKVKKASVEVEGKITGTIGQGILIFVGVHQDDTEKDLDWFVNKALSLRIFPNDEGKFDKSVLDIQGEVLVVSQFTLLGNCKKGRRPDFLEAAPPEKAENLYNLFLNKIAASGLRTEAGIFQAHMEVSLINDGPVTLLI